MTSDLMTPGPAVEDVVIDLTDGAPDASAAPAYQRRLVPLAIRRAGRRWWDGQRPGVRATSLVGAGVLFLAGTGMQPQPDPMADETVVAALATLETDQAAAEAEAARLAEQVAGLEEALEAETRRAELAERIRDAHKVTASRLRDEVAELRQAEADRAEAEAAEASTAVGASGGSTTTAAPVTGRGATRAARVIDGDTIEVGGVRIRLGLVNTPEQGEGCFDEATRFTSSFVSGGVTYDGYATDSYGRTVAEVFDGSGRSLNVAIAGSGLSDDRYYDQYAHENPDLARRVRAAYVSPRSDCFAGSSNAAGSSSSSSKGTNPWGTASCHAAYTPCVPPPGETGDLDCPDIRKKYPNGVKVDWAHGDPHRLDRDKDGKGCE